MLAEIMIICTFAVLLVAATIKFIHFIVGSPAGNEYETGRIFSAYGRFVTDKYVNEYNTESVRIWSKYEDWKAKRDEKLYEDLEKDGADKIELQKQYTDEVEAMLERVETWRRPNPWKALGACFICFGTWAACFIWSVLVPYLGIPVLLFPFLVAGSVVVANRVEI